ncbi:MAG: peptidylprolyl isomerase, partial [Boseongicola sp.]|nr:peptidylprolyl isomerase [Boseongicola sp.]
NRFRPVIQADDSIITEYQLTQRTRFLALLGAPGDPRALARDQLINESIQLNAAQKTGDLPNDEQVAAGLEEFAGRANLSAEEFITALGQEGVDVQTFRDFVRAGVAWRSHVQSTFRDEARGISDDVISRALANSGTDGGLRVLISEILLPATTPETTRASRARAIEISNITNIEEFAAAARLYSVSASRGRGGEINWVAIEGLPENVRSIISSLSPGQVSRPVDLGNSIGVFFLRDAETVARGSPETLTIDYALFTVPEGPDEAARISLEIDTCDDLYGLALDLPDERLIRANEPLRNLPGDIRSQIATLDVNEISTAVVRNNMSTVLMLCGRQQALESTVDFELVGVRLFNQRLGIIAADYLADLRANTYIADLAN